MLTKAIPLSEPFGTQEIFVSGLGRIEDLKDGNFRFVLYAMKNGDPEAVISLIMPMQAIPPAMCMAAEAIGMSFANTFFWTRPN